MNGEAAWKIDNRLINDEIIESEDYTRLLLYASRYRLPGQQVWPVLGHNLAVLVSTGSVYDYQKIKSTMIHTSHGCGKWGESDTSWCCWSSSSVEWRFKLAQETTHEDGVRSSTPTTGRFQSQCHWSAWRKTLDFKNFYLEYNDFSEIPSWLIWQFKKDVSTSIEPHQIISHPLEQPRSPKRYHKVAPSQLCWWRWPSSLPVHPPNNTSRRRRRRPFGG